MKQAFRGCFWYAHPRARMHSLPAPARLLFYRVCYLWQPVEAIAILLSYTLIHLCQKGKQKFECANHHYPVMRVAILNAHFVCRCFATVPYQTQIRASFVSGSPLQYLFWKHKQCMCWVFFPQDNGKWRIWKWLCCHLRLAQHGTTLDKH